MISKVNLVFQFLFVCFLSGSCLSAYAGDENEEPVIGMSSGKPMPKLKIPISGKSVAAMADFDAELLKFMRKWEIPGAAVAIVHKGKLVFSRGYGWSNQEEHKIMQPDALFRIASISKVVTAAAALKLIDDGKLSLDTTAFPILNLPLEKDPSRRPQELCNEITIKHLLQGTAGWDRNAAGDPMFMPIARHAAWEYSNSLRPTARAIIRYEYTRRLNFHPGTRFCYSNLGYSILGEVISAVSGKKYADYVRDAVLNPMGVKMIPGKTREEAPGEVHYYGYEGEAVGECIAPNVRGSVPLEYGGDFHLEAMTADCGWVASVVDVANFLSCLFGEQGAAHQVLSPKTVRLMISKPDLQEYHDKDEFFAMGWEITDAKSGQDITIMKVGQLPGSNATAVHKLDGTNFVIACNTRPKMTGIFQDETNALIKKTLSNHKNWLKQQN